jgi:hypothetical protein
MANELNIVLTASGETVTCQPYAAGTASGSPITLTEIGTSGVYTGDMTGSSGTYLLVFNDGTENVGVGSIVWSGTAELPLSTFNPATDTVARVTLTDTATTLTNSPDVPTEAEIASQVRTELSVELGRIDAAISSRLAPDGTLATVTTLTNAPTVPTAAAIADEVRVELAAELANLDAPVSGATAPSAGTVASQVRTELTAELAKIDALNTERLANVATTAIVGHLISQANS